MRWCSLKVHGKAFEFCGGLPEIVVPDDTKTGVDKACRYEPTVNMAHAEMAGSHGVATVPTRMRKPKDTGKVENAVLQVERWVLAPLRDCRTTIERLSCPLPDDCFVLIRETNGFAFDRGRFSGTRARTIPWTDESFVLVAEDDASTWGLCFKMGQTDLQVLVLDQVHAEARTQAGTFVECLLHFVYETVDEPASQRLSVTSLHS